MLALGVMALAASTTIATAQNAPGGSGRQYAPDRRVDILHIVIEVTPDYDARTIAGTTTIIFAPIVEPLTEVRLDAVDLSVSALTSSAAIAGYSGTDEAITITFEPPLPSGAKTQVTVVYTAETKEGLYFRTPAMGYRPEDMHLWTQGETHGAPHWFPNYDYPNERFTSEVICHVPEEMTVLSNGRLIAEMIEPGKRPRITLTPTMVFKGNRPVIGISVAGGDQQDQTSLQLLLNLLEFDMNPADAVTSPRFATRHFTGSFSQPGPSLGGLDLPNSTDAGVIDNLDGRGHNVRTFGGALAHPSMVVIDQDTMLIQAVGDPGAGRNAAAF